MTSSRWSKVFPCLLVAGLAWAPACGGDDDDEPAAGAGSSTGGSGTGGSGTGGSGTGGSGTGAQPAADCANRCGALTAQCGLEAGVCQKICSVATESQLACAEAANCNLEVMDRCIPPGGGSGTGGSGTGGSGTGGSGTGGSGTGGSGGGGGLPDSIKITGTRKVKEAPTHLLSNDQKSLTSSIGAEASATYSFPDARGKLQILTPGGREVLSPSSPTASECADIGDFNVSAQGDDVSFLFIGIDDLPNDACSDFAEAVHQGGLKIRFTDVPVFASQTKVAEVIVEIFP